MNHGRISDNDIEQTMHEHMALPPDAKIRIANAISERLNRERSGHKKRFRPYWAAAAAIAVTICAIFALIRHSGGKQTTDVVITAWNNCKIIRDSRPIPAVAGTELLIGDILETGPSAGLHLKTGDGSIICIAENSKLEYTALRGDRACTFSLFRGSILAKVAHDPENRFSVKTPDSTLKVLGTEFEVKVGNGVSLDNQDNNQKTEDRMKTSIVRKTAAFTALTVLSGAVAVTPLDAAETTVQSGSTARISADGTIVSPVKAREFIASMINASYSKDHHLWLVVPQLDYLTSSVYRFDPDSEKNEKVADFLGLPITACHQIGNGAVFSVWSVLIGDLNTVGSGSGNPIVNNQMMVLSSNGALLPLDNLTQYSPRYEALSPDGTKLAFVGTVRNGIDASCGTYIMDLGTLEVKEVYPGALKIVPAWSPDSSTILVSKGMGYIIQHQLVAVDVNSGEATDTAYKGCGAVFSPDGRYIAYSGNFRKFGENSSWAGGVPVCGDMLVAQYPDGKPVVFSSGSEGGALMPAFSPDGKRLSYIWRNEDSNELHVVDLKDNSDRKICRLDGFIYTPSWIGTDKIALQIAKDDCKYIGKIDLAKPEAGLEILKPDYPGNDKTAAADAALKPTFELYLAGLKAACNNDLAKAMENYRNAYAELTAAKDKLTQIDPAFKLESLSPYLDKFREYAQMDEETLYKKQLDYRMYVLAGSLDDYVAKFKRLPKDVDELAAYISANVSLNYIERGTQAAKIQFLMPDQQPGSPSAFAMKLVDDDTIEFISAPTPFGERYKITAVRENGGWVPQGEITPVE